MRFIPRPARNLARALAALGFVGGVVALLAYAVWAMTFSLDEVGQMPQRSAVFDMDGNFYSRLEGQNRILLSGGKIPERFRDALLAREDARFYRHGGIDPIGVLRAAVRNLLSASIREGGSTITQQLAKNSYGLRGRSLHRKLLEAMLALRIEHRFSKDEILRLYMDRIYYGSGLYGVETAAQTYFEKSSEALSVGEAAMLAGLIRSPNRFSPLNNPEGAKRERDSVLNRMLNVGMISAEIYEREKAAAPRIASGRQRAPQQNYAMDAVRRDLDLVLAEHHTDEGGLRIHTTIDPALMDAASVALDAHLTSIEKSAGFGHPTKAQFTAAQREAEAPTPYLQGAVVAIDNRTGGVRALVGGRDFSESKFNRAIMARRQIGSAFKPFVYAAAYDRGLLPRTGVSDGPLQAGEIRSVSTSWSPSNADGQFKGILAAEEGLVQSRNTMTVRVGELAGLEHVRHYGMMGGLGEEIPQLPSIYLGAFEATLKDLVTAYTVFPNAGLRRQSYIIERIDDASGLVIYRAAHVRMQALPADVSWMTAGALRQAMDRGTGAAARAQGFKKIAAGKTGTTDDYTDAWFVGFTSSLTCGVWVGMDRPARIMPRAYGSRLALPVWAKVMGAAPDSRYPAGNFPAPVSTARAQVCSVSGRLATRGCRGARTVYTAELPQGRIPTAACQTHAGGVLSRGSSGDSPVDRVGRTLRKFFRR